MSEEENLQYRPVVCDSLIYTPGDVLEFYLPSPPSEETYDYHFFKMKKNIIEGQSEKNYEESNSYVLKILKDYFQDKNKNIEPILWENNSVILKTNENYTGIITNLSSYTYILCVDIEEISRSPSFVFRNTNTPVNPSKYYGIIFPSHLTCEFMENKDDLDKIFIIGNVYLREITD
mgnify:CR=1 FL=1